MTICLHSFRSYCNEIHVEVPRGIVAKIVDIREGKSFDTISGWAMGLMVLNIVLDVLQSHQREHLVNQRVRKFSPPHVINLKFLLHRKRQGAKAINGNFNCDELIYLSKGKTFRVFFLSYRFGAYDGSSPFPFMPLRCGGKHLWINSFDGGFASIFLPPRSPAVRSYREK